MTSKHVVYHLKSFVLSVTHVQALNWISLCCRYQQTQSQLVSREVVYASLLWNQSNNRLSSSSINSYILFYQSDLWWSVASEPVNHNLQTPATNGDASLRGHPYQSLPCASPDSKVHGDNTGPIWGRQDPGGPHVGPMNFVIWVVIANLIHEHMLGCVNPDSRIPFNDVAIVDDAILHAHA